ncbi:alpha/beta hydrolase fold domain-containing protein [Streptomyces sp. NPDC005507]|uniref:alpha/beta hydrolase fold domain-containing protein n=1 Tax=Streptomyces sp. NPDC005507 TaxID=3154885 RepID=UPI0033AFA8C8
MTTSSEFVPTQVPARAIPVPSTVSPEAQAFLALPQPLPRAWPEDLSDKDALAKVYDEWAAEIESSEQALKHMSAGLLGTVVQDYGATTVEHVLLGGVSVYIATPEGVTDEDPRTLLAIHGAWVFGTGEFSRLGALYMAVAHGVRTWVVDYRMPPHHPYPVPLNDCMAAYSAMLEKYGPENVAISGTSGGGNLGLALLLRAHDEGIPMPVAAVINTPYADVTHAGDTYQTLHGIDISYAPGDLDLTRLVYLDGHDPLDPYVSPVYGNYSEDFPPVMLTTGTRDFLLSETCRVHRRLLASGVEAELHCWEAAQHLHFGASAPEDFERATTAKRFLDARWGKARG